MEESFFKNNVTRVSSFFKVLASASLMAMMLLTCLDVFMRYFFNWPITGTYDLVSLIGAVLAAFAMPYTMLDKGHVAVELLVMRLSRTSQVIIETLTHATGIAMFLVLAWHSILLAQDMKSAGEVTPTLLIPFYPILICIAVCFIVLCLAILVNLLDILLKRSER